ncbi:MAG TPA: hypothetical protein VIH16_05205 [Bellilinea sp.]
MLNRVLLFMIGLLLAGCSVLPIATATQPAATATLTPAPSATATISPTVTPTFEPTATEVILPEPGVCSPLAGYTLTDLASLVVNSYHPPRLGSDDPHQGVDFGILDPVQGYALEGNPVQVVLAGKVVGVTVDRFPYGNMLMIETALDETAPAFTPQLLLPTPLPQRLPRGALTCPELNIAPAAADAPRSLYILYGHMLNPPTAALGDSVGCGQEIGAIGQSGNALNPHVHVEVRVGPANQTFTSMAHYDPSAGYEEMAAYCLWRVSGVYQTIDPGCLWGACTTP